MIVLLEDLDKVFDSSDVGDEIVVCYRLSFKRRILYKRR